MVSTVSGNLIIDNFDDDYETGSREWGGVGMTKDLYVNGIINEF